MSRPGQVQRVLVAVDFEEPSASAVAVGGAIARAFGAALTVVHAETLDMPPYFTGTQVEALETERREAGARVAADVREFAARHTDVPLEPIVAEGPPADAILKLAPGFDVIVLGTHRFKGARRWWLGSVAESVVRRTKVPVIVAPGVGGPGHGLGSPGALILATAPHDAATEGWVSALGGALQATIARAVDLESCPPDRLRDAALLVVPLPAPGDVGSQLGAIVRVLRECSRPVLFVPAAGPAVERSAS